MPEFGACDGRQNPPGGPEFVGSQDGLWTGMTAGPVWVRAPFDVGGQLASTRSSVFVVRLLIRSSPATDYVLLYVNLDCKGNPF